MVLCDLPYGVTNCEWDRKIDMRALWAQYERVLRPGGAVVLFAQCPFCWEAMAAAPKGWFRYEWIWHKGRRGLTGFLNAKKMPMRAHEAVLVFGRGIRYRPQGLRPFHRVHGGRRTAVYHGCAKASTQTRTGYPNTVLEFAREDAAAPAQKPVALLEYLVRTYTRKGELVLDNAMGLGSTGVAALKCGRKFAGIEIDAERFGVARQRIEAALESPAAPGGQDESRPTTEAL
jgi:site-specific DNA-methyltransferase (adenine-specific)